jgi:hypothetical protein
VLTAIPTLDDLARDPSRAQDLPADAIAALAMRCATVHAALAAAAWAVNSRSSHKRPTVVETSKDRLLNETETEAMLGRPRRWIFRNADKLPFIRRVSAKHFVASERELSRWLGARNTDV